MTPGLRERVAELMGTHKVERDAPSPFKKDCWEREHPRRGTLITDSKGRHHFSGIEEGGSTFATHSLGFQFIPDYPGDLNHAHAAVRALLVTNKLKINFMLILQDIVGARWTDHMLDVFLIFTATPEQMMEALLRTLGGEEGA